MLCQIHIEKRNNHSFLFIGIIFFVKSRLQICLVPIPTQNENQKDNIQDGYKKLLYSTQSMLRNRKIRG